MNSKQIDKALRDFEKKYPIIKKTTTKPFMKSFTNNIEKQLDKLDREVS